MSHMVITQLLLTLQSNAKFPAQNKTKRNLDFRIKERNLIES